MARFSYQTYTIRRLSEMVNNGHLDLNPDWQRGSVWTREQRPKLIDSLENGYPIPQITLWTRPQGKFIMVDGKQRTETIVGFTHDDFASLDNIWFSGKNEAEQEAFLDIEIYALVFQSRVDEEFIVEYFERINSESKQLSNGEMINSLCIKPIVSTIDKLFFNPGTFQTKWTETFAEPSSSDKRMKFHENTVPYLTSSLYGVECLTKTYPTIASKLKNTDQATVLEHMDIFQSRIDQFIEICKSIFESCPHLKPNWIRQGLPPLRQMSPIWLSILEPQLIQGDLIIFWTSFYRKMSDYSTIKTQWELNMRKNGKPNQLYKEIQYAISESI